MVYESTYLMLLYFNYKKNLKARDSIYKKQSVDSQASTVIT